MIGSSFKEVSLDTFLVGQNILVGMSIARERAVDYYDKEKMRTIYDTIMALMGGEANYKKVCEHFDDKPIYARDIFGKPNSLDSPEDKIVYVTNYDCDNK